MSANNSRLPITSTDAKRSALMGRVRHFDTQPELRLREELKRSSSLRRLRLDYGKDLPGSPDIVIRRLYLAIFVDGCFWHGCPKHGSVPKTNRSFWQAKIKRNQARDKKADKNLRKLGWATLRFWEHDIRENIVRVVAKIEHAVQMQKSKLNK
jgi:DNA mismatch endonuclease (patch repair protein)